MFSVLAIFPSIRIVPKMNANEKVLIKIAILFSKIDQEIEENKPWVIEDLAKLKELLQAWVIKIDQIAFELKPFLPESSEKIKKIFSESRVKPTEPLFPRIK